MTNDDASLDGLQRWLLNAITEPANGAEVSDVLLPSRQMAAEDRLAVYQNAYFARLIEALRDFFPCLAATLGEETFAQFALAYVGRHPPRSYTLHRLADDFVRFLEETQPTDTAGSSDASASRDSAARLAASSRAAAAPSWTAFWIDLARLEFAIDRIFDGPGPEGSATLSHDDLTAIAPDDWSRARLTLVAGFELLAFRFPVSQFYSAWKQGEPSPIPLPEPTYLALWRRDYVVRRRELTQAQFVLLSRLQKSDPLETALAMAAEHIADLDQFARELPEWFQQWGAEQFFASVSLLDEQQ